MVQSDAVQYLFVKKTPPSCLHPRPCGPGCDPLARLSASGPRAALVTAHAGSFMLANNPARFRRTRQHSASFSSPPSPQPKRRPRSRLLHFHRSVFACALVGPFGEGVVAAPPRPRHRSGPPYPSASSSPAHAAPVRITPFYCWPSVTAKRSSHRARCVGHGSCRGGLRLVLPASPPAHPIILRYVRVVRCASTARFAARPSG